MIEFDKARRDLDPGGLFLAGPDVVLATDCSQNPPVMLG